MNNSLHFSPKTVVFLHIPKTAGTSLNEIICRQYEPQCRFWFDAALGQKAIDDFQCVPISEKSHFQLIAGHISFGIHQFFPQNCTYVTLLREPVERVISNYYYILRSPSHHLHQSVVSKNMSLEEFIVSKTFTDIDNGQTRRIAGVNVGRLSGQETVEFGQCSEKLLEQAKKNFSKFSVVGITENFDETLLLLQQGLGWKKSICYVKRNVGENKPVSASIPETTLKLIENYNQLDIELYKYAKTLFDQKILEGGLEFQKQLKFFKNLNKAYTYYCSYLAELNHFKATVKSVIKR